MLSKFKPALFILILLGSLCCSQVYASSIFSSVQQADPDPVGFVIFWVSCIFAFGVAGRYIAKRFDQPGVLGELLAGVLIGNLFYRWGVHLFVILREGPSVFTILSHVLEGQTLEQSVHQTILQPKYADKLIEVLKSYTGIEYIKEGYILDVFSRYGAIFLLFMVGLESSFQELRRTGREAVQVAVLGVIAPIILGYFVALYLVPDTSSQTALFVAATLSATSIGITARVLSDMKKLQTREAKTILGAAMLDDVLGLVILAIVSEIVVEGHLAWGLVFHIIFSALLFFGGALWLGPWFLRKAIWVFRSFALWEAKLFVSLLFMMLLSWLATEVNLAAIIGAFTAGLIIHDGYFEGEHTKNRLNIRELIAPFEAILAPLFFILIGIQVKLETFADWQVLIVAFGLIVAAIIGKLICGWGANPKDDRWLVGIGMIPRGEVGLVFASIGRSLGVISDALFSAIILMIIVTTILAPVLLKRRFLYREKLA